MSRLDQRPAVFPSVLSCARCGKILKPRAQVVVLKSGADNIVTHPYPRCYSEWDDVLVQQGMITKDGDAVGPVVPD